MSDHFKTTRDESMVNEAAKIIKGLREHQKNSTEKFSQIDKQIGDLEKANRLLTESVQTLPVESVGGDERLKSFIEKDGKIRWETKTAKVSVPGKGNFHVEEEGLLDSKVPANEWHRELIKIAQERAFVRMVMPEHNPSTPKSDLKLYRHLQKAPRELQSQIRAFSDNAGVGAEWIPDQFVPELHETFQIPRGLRALMPSVECDRATVLLPRLSKGGRPYRKGTVTTDDPALFAASTVTTAQKSINLRGMAVRYVIDDSALEDSAIALMPTLSRQIAQDLEDGWEDCAINGDTTATHGDTGIANWDIRGRWGSSGLGGSDDHRRSFIGLRHAAFDRSTASAVSSGNLALSDMVTAFGAMGELGAQDRYIIVSPEAAVKQLLDLSEVLTVNNFGSAATILNGQIGSLFGAPIIISRFLSSDLNNSGVYDNVTKTDTGILVYNTGSWFQYNRGGIVVETDKDIRSGAVSMVATMRNVMDTPDSDTATNCAFLYNLS